MWRWFKWVLLALLIIGIFLIILAILRSKTGLGSNLTGSEVGVSALGDGKFLSGNNCEGEKKPKLTNLPMNEKDFSYIIPYGLVVDNHVTPIDHQYFQPTVFKSPRDTYPVYAMADAKLVGIEKRDKPDADYEYRLVFSMSCKLFYYYDLVTSLSPQITQELGSQNYKKTNIEVRAGQEIGKIGGRTLDFAVWDMDVWLSGFINPKHYEAESWKIHTADPLLYYADELKQKALAKYLRTEEPRSGKIDYDIDGKLVGTWFLEGINGFGSLKVPDPDNYKGHFSIAPDYLDPTSFVFSIGDYQGEATQFGIKGNSPNPTNIGLQSGQIKYELVTQEWADETGNRWDRISIAKGLKAKNDDRVVGVALIQMLENRKMKMELFPWKTAEQVNEFTNNAKVYER